MPKYLLPNVKNFNKVWYVSPTGNDTTGDGSEANPFKNYSKAFDQAVSGDAIKMMAGYHEVLPVTQDGYCSVAFYDQGKKLHVFGENDLTVCAFHSSNTGSRDANLFYLWNAETIISNMTIHFYVGKSSSYMNAIFRWTNANFHNLFIENKGTRHWSVYYYNDQKAVGPKVTNCIFKSNAFATSNYSGYGVMKNVLVDFPLTYITNSAGQNNISRTITANDSDLTLLPTTLLDKGVSAILDPDGTVSNIGVCGGPYGWGYYDAILKTFILSNGEYFKLNPTTYRWSKVSTGLPTAEMFDAEGMDSMFLDALVLINTLYPMTLKSTSPTDRVFTGEINLKDIVAIKSIT